MVVKQLIRLVAAMVRRSVPPSMMIQRMDMAGRVGPLEIVFMRYPHGRSADGGWSLAVEDGSVPTAAGCMTIIPERRIGPFGRTGTVGDGTGKARGSGENTRRGGMFLGSLMLVVMVFPCLVNGRQEMEINPVSPHQDLLFELQIIRRRMIPLRREGRYQLSSRSSDVPRRVYRLLACC